MAFLLIVLMLIPAPRPLSEAPCELRKIHRHKPRVCTKGGCEQCANKACARMNCMRPKKTR